MGFVFDPEVLHVVVRGVVGMPVDRMLPTLVEQDYKSARLHGRQNGLALFFNDPPRVAARVVAISQLRDGNASKPPDAPDVIFNQLPDRTAFRLPYPNKAQLHYLSYAPRPGPSMRRSYNGASSHKGSCG